MAEEHNLTDEMIAGRRGDATQLPSDMPRWMAGTIRSIEALSRLVGWIVSWFVVVIMGSMIYEVVARYVFTAPTIWAYDMSRMFCGAAFVLGGGYALARGVHIRSDFLYRNWSVRTQARVDTLLYLVFFFPTMLILLWVYYSALILFLGAEFTQVWADRRGHRVRPEPGAVEIPRASGVRPT